MVIRNWILYIATVVSLAVFSVLYIKHSGFVVLMMAAIVPLVYSAITFFLDKRSVRVVFNHEVLSATKSKKLEIPIVVESRSEITRGSTAVLYITAGSGLGFKSRAIRRKIPLISRREETLLTLVPEHSGVNEIRVEKIRIYNGFSLFCPVIPVDAGISFLVMPEYREFAIEPEVSREEKEGESERYSSFKAGNDPSELYDIRSYRPGDKLNHINWKFSAKNSELMVQDYGFPIACDTAVVIDVSGETDLDKIDKVIEILYFLAVKFTMSDKLFYVIWKDYHEEKVKRKMISDQEDIYDLLMSIFHSDMGKYEDPIEDIYDIQYEGEFLSGCIFIYAGRKQMEDEVVRMKLRTDALEFVHV